MNRPEISDAARPGQDADAWFTPWRFAALLALLIVACFPKVVFGLETFFYRDFGAFAYPLAFYHREAFWRGELPLWNPYSFCGVPFLAQWNTLTLYPPSLFYLIFPLTWSLGVFNLAHLFWAGLGMYFLAHRWTGNRLAASVAGMVYAFNGLSWCALMWSNNIAALGWMPWVVLSVERAWREGGGRNLVLAALAGAMQMLSGAPEVIILTWFALAMLWLAECISLFRSRRLKETDGEAQVGISGGQMVFRLLSVIGLVAGLAAAQLLPFMDLLLHSQRDTSFGGSEWSMPPGGWANFLVPLFHCAVGPQNVYFQSFQGWTASYYLGAATVALALMAVWRVRERRMWVLAGLAAFSLTMALGDRGGVYAVVRNVAPLMGVMRYPIKFVVLAAFVVPLLAAQAASWWQALPEGQWRTERKKLWTIGGLLLGAMMFILWWEWFGHRLAWDNPSAITKNALVRAVFLVLILLCVVMMRRLTAPKARRLLGMGLLLLFWSDILTHIPNLSPTVEHGAFEPDLIPQYHLEQHDSKWVEQLKLGEARAMPEWPPLSKVMFRSADKADNDVLGRRLALFGNYNLLDHAPKSDGFFSLSLREMDDLNRRTAIATTNNSVPRYKDFLGISYVNNPKNPVDWVARDTFLPMITAGQQPVFLDDTNALQGVIGPGFDPARFVFLPLASQQFVTATNHSEAKILAIHFEAERVDMDVEAGAPAMVVVAQAFYHFWHAYVDGKPTPLCRANYAFQALEVPGGKHHVSLVYEDRSFFYGSILSLISLLGCAIVWFWRRRDGVKGKQTKDAFNQ